MSVTVIVAKTVVGVIMVCFDSVCDVGAVVGVGVAVGVGLGVRVEGEVGVRVAVGAVVGVRGEILTDSNKFEFKLKFNSEFNSEFESIHVQSCGRSFSLFLSFLSFLLFSFSLSLPESGSKILKLDSHILFGNFVRLLLCAHSPVL